MKNLLNCAVFNNIKENVPNFFNKNHKFHQNIQLLTMYLNSPNLKNR